MGSVIKCMAVYDEPFWQASGLTGQATDVQGPAQLTFDNSPPSGRPGVILAFVEGAHPRELSHRPAAERKEAVVACIARSFGADGAHRGSSSSSIGRRSVTAEVATGLCSGLAC